MKAENKTLNIALCAGRHEIPAATDGAIFPFEVNPFDFKGMEETARKALRGFQGGNGTVNLYITGMTSAALTVAAVCFANDINLIAWHFDRDSGNYIPQTVNAVYPCPFCGHPFGNGTHCAYCGAT